MAARKLKQVAAPVNEAAINQASESPAQDAAKAPASLVIQNAAIWAAVGKLCAANDRRDDLPDGIAKRVDVYLAARVDGGPVYRKGWAVDLSVGHGSQRASSSLPNTGKIVGAILGLLNTATREAVLRDLPALYAASGGDLPDVDPAIASAAEGMLAKLRASKQVDVRGSVSAKAVEQAAPVGLVE